MGPGEQQRPFSQSAQKEYVEWELDKMRRRADWEYYSNGKSQASWTDEQSDTDPPSTQAQ